jgi:hypothetical protein
MLAKLDPDVRSRCRELAVELLQDAGYPHPGWSLAAYEPRRMPVAARHASYAANLLCFVVLLSAEPVNVAELVPEPFVINWHRQAMLWLSQLHSGDRGGLWRAFRVAWRVEGDTTVLRIAPEDGRDVSVYASPTVAAGAEPITRPTHSHLRQQCHGAGRQ